MHRAALAALGLLPTALAGHCYSIASCGMCVADSGGSPCAWCAGSCQMATDACAAGLVLDGNSCDGATPPPLAGEPFFEDISTLLRQNPVQRNYGVAVTDTNADGVLEFVVAGNGAANLVYQWDGSGYAEIAPELMKDRSGKAIGVAACDVDEDGYEELYVLNTDQYSGSTRTSDKLYDRDEAGGVVELFDLPVNRAAANYVAGRSCACVDRKSNGKYGVLVANYGGPMKLFEHTGGGAVTDVGKDAGIDKTTGGRALVSGPILSSGMDIFANNEGWRGRRLGGANASATERRLGHRANFFFVNDGDGSFTDSAATLGLLDADNTGRGTALFDANQDGLIDIVYGNWEGPHRLFIQRRDGDRVGFTDAAPAAMAVPSRIRTVIVADFDNDGFEEIFFNNIPGSNRLFRKLPSDADWTQINIGAAEEPSGFGTGGAVGDFDGDGVLELVVAHGESTAQPLSLFKAPSAAGRNWLRVKPLTRHGAPARGAVVTLIGADRQQLRVIDAGSGYLCQMEPVAHFGLGAQTSVEAVQVRWPGDVCVTLTGPAVNQLLEVPFPAEGSEGCPEGDFSSVDAATMKGLIAAGDVDGAAGAVAVALLAGLAA